MSIESTMLESVFPQFVGAQPYHYYGLWLNALLTWATGWSALWCLCLSTYAVLFKLVLLGLRALIAHYKLAAFWAWGLTALLFLSGGVNWPVFAQYSFTRVGRLLAGSYVLMEPKQASITLFMALGALLLVRRRYDLAGLMLAVIPLVYVSTGPAIGGSVFVLAVYLCLSRRATPVQVLVMLASVVLAVSYFGLFYVTQPALHKLAEAGKTLVEEVVPRVSKARALLNIFIGLLLLYVCNLGYRFWRAHWWQLTLCGYAGGKGYCQCCGGWGPACC